MRQRDHSFVPPADLAERQALLHEAQHYQLHELAALLEAAGSCSAEPGTPGQSAWLHGCVSRARQLCSELAREWQTSRQLHELKDLVLQHLVEVPLQHRQAELARCAAVSREWVRAC